MYNNPSVNLATSVAYVDGRTGEGRAAGASAGGGSGRTSLASPFTRIGKAPKDVEMGCGG